MTNNERKLAEQETKAKFYAWRPADADLQKRFRCQHLSSTPIMHEKICQARAVNPELYRDLCGGSPTCPRWKHYRKLHKKAQQKNDGLERRAYR